MKIEIEIDQETDRCNYPYCEKQDHGKCIDKESLKDCRDFALAVLCVKGNKDGNDIR